MLFYKIGVSTTYYDPLDCENIIDLIQSNTKVVFLESQSSLTMEVPDVPAIVKKCGQKIPIRL